MDKISEKRDRDYLTDILEKYQKNFLNKEDLDRVENIFNKTREELK
jgi:hypothetical protein